MQFGQKLDPNGDGCNETLKNKRLIRKKHNTETERPAICGDKKRQTERPTVDWFLGIRFLSSCLLFLEDRILKFETIRKKERKKKVGSFIYLFLVYRFLCV